MSQKPTLKLAPRLLMTPALQQAIKLLQLTRLELEQVVRAELEANPLLELADGLEHESPAVEDETGALAGPEEQALAESTRGELGEDGEGPGSLEEVELSALFANDLHDVSSQAGWGVGEEEDTDPLLNLPNPEPSLADALLGQLALLPLPEALRPLCEFLVGNLEPDGYLRTPLRELSQQVGVEEPLMEEALAWIQQLDPPGVGARNLQECFLLQLRRRSNPTAMEKLALAVVEQAFSLLLQQEWGKIAEQFGVTVEDVRGAMEVLRKLPPHPGLLLGSTGPTAIEPDVVVRKVGNRWQVELVDDRLPEVHLSPRYLQLLRNRSADRQTLTFVRERFKHALWFLRAVEQRHHTILRVAEAIVRRQEAFLDHGLQFLRPMVLRDVADELGIHESTVSRVVQGKYMATPRGVLPFKFFFHSSLGHALAGDVSSVVVKEKIRELILGEDPRKPLADSKIARQLNRQGIRIARRTVAKYREELGIPSSELRKRGLWMKGHHEASKIGPR
ncbi:MAG: RNA polymerase factor sigma-54 [Thermoanaerobaculum sp.]|nr:RNA polymerase factor sigma-54 [Thermoanaerobaculum sp.]